jgi:1-acyl-sn-glycerol-3-phosphate acyltransferase
MNALQINVRKLIQDKNPKLLKKLPGFVISYIERIVHEKEINAFLAKHGHLKNFEFCDEVLHHLKINVQFQGIERIPKTGPVILVLNHPLGGVDGVAFISAMKSHRKDLVFLVNDLLLNMTPLKDLFVGVNKHGKNKADTREKISAMFNSDQAICIFPAGLVSRKIKGKIQDLEWKRTFVNYARTTGHPVIPIFIDGKLSNFFYRLHQFRTFVGIKSSIEMLYLADELFKQQGKSIVFNVGNPIIIEADDPRNDQKIASDIKDLLYQIPHDNASHHS